MRNIYLHTNLNQTQLSDTSLHRIVGYQSQWGIIWKNRPGEGISQEAESEELNVPWSLPALKCVLRRQHFPFFGCSLCVLNCTSMLGDETSDSEQDPYLMFYSELILWQYISQWLLTSMWSSAFKQWQLNSYCHCKCTGPITSWNMCWKCNVVDFHTVPSWMWLAAVQSH